MGRFGWILPTVLLAAVGCDRGNPLSGPTPAPQAAPATQPGTTQPTTEPATVSRLTIDGKVYSFPPARLRVSKSGEHVTARLYTNDPKAALGDDYHGNGYDLVMKLDDITEPSEVYSSVWQYRNPDPTYVDSPYGIFLDGIKYQLQPSDVTARFLGDTLLVRIDLQGRFLQFDQSDGVQVGRQVYVKGSLLAPVEYRE